MKNLDISKIPPQFVRFWWLSKVIRYFDDLIISPEQVHLFSVGGDTWDLYRHHMIYVRDEIGTRTMAEYRRGTVFAGATGEQGSTRLYFRSGNDSKLTNIKSV